MMHDAHINDADKMNVYCDYLDACMMHDPLPSYMSVCMMHISMMRTEFRDERMEQRTSRF